MLGRQIGDELVADHGVHAVRIGEVHVVELAAQGLPENGDAAGVLVAPQVADHQATEPVAMLCSAMNR